MTDHKTPDELIAQNELHKTQADLIFTQEALWLACRDLAKLRGMQVNDVNVKRLYTQYIERA